MRKNNNKDNLKNPPPYIPYILDRKARKAGVYYLPPAKDGQPVSRMWICSPVEVLARTRDEHNLNHGRLLQWKDDDNRNHQWIFPKKLLAGDGAEIRKTLLDGGVNVSVKRSAREHLLNYLQEYPVDNVVLSVLRTGWKKGAYVLPDAVIGDTPKEKVILQSDLTTIEGYETKGTIESWRNDISVMCFGQHRLVYSISAAFAAPLLSLLNMSGVGFHFVGRSSSGKSTALRVAKSVVGDHRTIPSWRATSNALESLAALHNDALLCLDELGEAEPREAAAASYMLSQGQGKSRQKRDGGLRETITWKTLFLSSGEVSLSGLLAEVGKSAKAGQMVRIIDMPVDAGKELGIFDHIPEGFAGGAEFSDYLKDKTLEHHGLVFREYLKKLLEKKADCIDSIKSFKDEWLSENVPESADGQVVRVAGSFALVAAAGELATDMELTGWDRGDANEAAKICFKGWLKHRGGFNSQEERDLLRQVKYFFEEHGAAKFTYWEQDKNHENTLYRKGFRNEEGDYFVFPEGFNKDVIGGFDRTFAINILKDRGYLITPKKGNTVSVRVPANNNNTARFYQISSSILDGEA